jgi:hypothetical protein
MARLPNWIDSNPPPSFGFPRTATPDAPGIGFQPQTASPLWFRASPAA